MIFWGQGIVRSLLQLPNLSTIQQQAKKVCKSYLHIFWVSRWSWNAGKTLLEFFHPGFVSDKLINSNCWRSFEERWQFSFLLTLSQHHIEFHSRGGFNNYSNTLQFKTVLCQIVMRNLWLQVKLLWPFTPDENAEEINSLLELFHSITSFLWNLLHLYFCLHCKEIRDWLWGIYTGPSHLHLQCKSCLCEHNGFSLQRHHINRCFYDRSTPKQRKHREVCNV